MALNPLNESSTQRTSGNWKDKLSKAASQNALAAPKNSKLFTPKESKRNLVKRLSRRIDSDYLRKIGITAKEKESADPKLMEEIKQLNAELLKEKIKNRETNESLAMLSQTMFKKLMDEENAHLEEMNVMEIKYKKMEQHVTDLEESKTQLLIESNKMIDAMREHIRSLSKRLESHEQSV